MKLKIKKGNEILSGVGLSRIMNSDPNMPNYIDEDKLFSTVFTNYCSEKYLNSDREMDEVYRFSNVIMLHKATGLRFEYSEYEYLSGEVEYKLLNIFIITKNHEELAVEDVDFENKIVVAGNRNIPFSNLKKNSRGD
jgi:hypothetical protein